jgi:serine/threonine protein kinase
VKMMKHLACILLLQATSYKSALSFPTCKHPSIRTFVQRTKISLDQQIYGIVPPDSTMNKLIVGNKYALTDKLRESTSGKSKICEALRLNAVGQPIGKPVTMKISSNSEALERENDNYIKLDDTEGLFVRILDFLPRAETNGQHFQDKSALVMESGSEDLRSFLKTHGPLDGDELRETVRMAARCVGAVHEKKMVWTEAKAENFVVKNDGRTIKGIDLESAVRHRDNPIDFSAEACPPEFALAFLCGREPFVEMEYHFDVWSLGMVLYEIATGQHYFGCEDNMAVIAAQLRNTKQIDLSQQPINNDLKDLIAWCLQIDPVERPTLEQILQHKFLERKK